MSDKYSPNPSRSHASSTDRFGNLDEDDSTYPVGYRWLHCYCAGKAILPKYSTFVTSNYSPERQYHVSQIVIPDFDTPRMQSVYENAIWALENEGMELRDIKNCNYYSKRSVSARDGVRRQGHTW